MKNNTMKKAPLPRNANLFRLAPLSVAVMMLNACASGNLKAPQETDAGKRMEVSLTRMTHVVKFDGATTLPSTEATAINAFIANNRIGYGDTLSVDVSGGSALRRAAIAEQLRLNGLMLSGEPPVLEAAPQPGTAILIVERHVVTPPECPDWSRAASPNYENLASSNFGCANQTNLGMMIADPADLLAGRSANGTAVGGAAARPLDTLRNVTQSEGVSTRGLVLSKTSKN